MAAHQWPYFCRVLVFIGLCQPHLAVSLSPDCISWQCHPASQAAGSPCPSSEGLWNCLTHSWQRCANGAWSIGIPCAEGTICAPAGLTYDLRIAHEDGRDDGLSQGTSLPNTHHSGQAEGATAVVKMHAGLVAAALLVHSWAVTHS